jgi:hypothetical protein
MVMIIGKKLTNEYQKVTGKVYTVADRPQKAEIIRLKIKYPSPAPFPLAFRGEKHTEFPRCLGASRGQGWQPSVRSRPPRYIHSYPV